VLQKNVTKQREKKKPFRILFICFEKGRSSGKKRNVKANERNEADGQEEKKRQRLGRDEHYSNLFTVGPMIRHNDINKQS
jgi:hypothetical protein